MRSRFLDTLIACALLIAALPLTACNSGESGYHLKGKVVRGSQSVIMIVDQDDERLNFPAIGGASLHLQQDPGRLQRETLATGVSGPDGTFSMKVDRFGAGWLEYDVGLFVRRDGFTPAELPFRLPDKSRRVLVMMGEGVGRDLSDDEEDLYGEAKRYTQ